MGSFQGYDVREQVGETLHSIVYRANRRDTSDSVIIKALKTLHPTAAEIARFKHEYELICNTQIEGIVKVLDILQTDKGIALVLEDFNSVPLKAIIRQGVGMERFIDFAVRMAAILGNLHHKNITHQARQHPL